MAETDDKKPEIDDKATEPVSEAAPVVDKADPPAAEESPEDTKEYDDAFDEFAGGGEPSAEPITDEKPPAEAEPQEIGTSQAVDADDKPLAKETAPAPEPAPDIWEGATDAQKAAFADADKDAHKWQSDTGRAGRDAGRIAKLESDLASRTAPVTAAPETDIKTVFESEPWKHFQTELPEAAEPLKKILEGFGAKNATLERGLATLSDDKSEEVLTAQKAIITSEHSDWESVVDGQEFMAWIGAQPAHVQGMYDRNAARIVDGQEVAAMLSLYRPPKIVPPAPEPPVDGSSEDQPAAKGNGSEPTKRERYSQRRLEGNVNVPSKGPGAPSGAPEDYDGAWDFYAAKVAAAKVAQG